MTIPESSSGHSTFVSTWLRRPHATWLRKAMFQVHLWLGLILGLYIVVVCVSGSALVFRNDLYNTFEDWIRAGKATEHDRLIRVSYILLRWFGDLHGRLLLGPYGMVVNAIGGFLTAGVCVTGLILWWPGIARWRRALIVRGGVGWKRFNFDLHSAVGFWTFAILFVWGMTGGYFVFPEPFRAVINMFTPIDPPRVAPQQVLQRGTQGPQPSAQTAPAQSAPVPRPAPQAAPQSAVSKSSAPAPAAASSASSKGPAQQVTAAAQNTPAQPFPRRRRRPLTKGGKILQWFSFLHYGNFAGWGVKTIWTILGLAPAFLFGTALVMYWNRVLSPALRRSRRNWQPSAAPVPTASAVASQLEWERE